MTTRRLFSYTLAISTAAAAAQVALAESNVLEADAQAACTPTALVRHAMWVQGPCATESRHHAVIQAIDPDRVAGSTLLPSNPTRTSVI